MQSKRLRGGPVRWGQDRNDRVALVGPLHHLDRKQLPALPFSATLFRLSVVPVVFVNVLVQ